MKFKSKSIQGQYARKYKFRERGDQDGEGRRIKTVNARKVKNPNEYEGLRDELVFHDIGVWGR